MRLSPVSLLVLLVVGANAFQAPSTATITASNTQLHAYRQSYQYRLDIMTEDEIAESFAEMDKAKAKAVENDKGDIEAAAKLADEIATLEQKIAELQAQKDKLVVDDDSSDDATTTGISLKQKLKEKSRGIRRRVKEIIFG
uniref:Uncharacterized protein n=1 Tax=Grammatophora oceanica TaxID=210454 RepID=A0A7S1Y5E8_9STRA|mmetsp:Transcript_30247/g.44718  ORF Transcript_30247/g.44718 Transcript_30247/m.44718 type:complete len:141 (+) Transcript_30247:175-597(+)|eukprot:CAMPEP_0194032412 /NCGR_PEP_ID=MMETSP0009_2-20130614/5359_1 /TAXON_ID=210454 /ORGANISM="Grammatophora oceanica, Strain CCMP 410" /LENGTH=140 /DNA_ID=CAMNT_0038672853 /DNA_START=174 /DNA_END=596 /DNA_ORIENTATION=+